MNANSTLKMTLNMTKVVARKDLQVEWRSRVLLNRVVPFAGITMVMFGFALGTTGVLARVAPGLIWMAMLFCQIVIVERSFSIETEDGALDALRVAGVDPLAVFWGKSIALAIQLLVLNTVLVLTSVVLYGVTLEWSRVGLLLLTCCIATAGLALVGTLYGGLTAGYSGRETLLPLLVFPVIAPVLIGATKALEAAFGTAKTAMSEGWPWIGLLTVYAIALGVGGSLAFGPLIDEAN